jgi:hypothetical protein
VDEDPVLHEDLPEDDAAADDLRAAPEAEDPEAADAADAADTADDLTDDEAEDDD